MFTVALVTPFFHFYLALRKRFIAFIGLGTVAFVLGRSVMDHPDPQAIVMHFTTGAVLALAVFAAYTFFYARS
jgi:hypothetical protein